MKHPVVGGWLGKNNLKPAHCKLTNIILAGAEVTYRSTDEGASWTQDLSHLNHNVLAIAFAKSAPNVVYKVISQLGVSKSTDTGQTWTLMNSGLTDINVLAVVGVDPNDANRVIAAANSGKVFKSTDGGANWVPLAPPPSASNPVGILIDPRNPTTILIGCRNNGVYKSTNGGASWFPAKVSSGTTTNSLTFAPNNPDIIYETEANQVYRSLNGGLNWTLLPTAGLNTSYTSAVAVDPNLRVLVGGSGGVFAFDDQLCPTLTQFYPITSGPGKTITLTGTNFVPGTQVFFGGPRLIPAASVMVENATRMRVVVPSTSTGAGNVNGYITVRLSGCSDVTSETLPALPNLADPEATYPRFLLCGDTSLDGAPFNAADLALERAFLQFQALPNLDQLLTGDLIPLNANGSRGNGTLTTTDFTFMRAVANGQATP